MRRPWSVKQARPPRERKLDGEGEARLIALACGEPPEGRDRWTLELLADALMRLKVVDSTEVLAFGGTESVDVTESFDYTAGGWQTHAEAAIVGVSVCECNGLGFHFFRKTGAVLAPRSACR